MSDLEDDLSAILSFGSSRRSDNGDTSNYSGEGMSSAAQDFADYNLPSQNKNGINKESNQKSQHSSDSNDISGIEISSIMTNQNSHIEHENLMKNDNSSDNFSDILSSVINNSESASKKQETETKKESDTDDSERMSQILSGINSSMSNKVNSNENMIKDDQNSSNGESNGNSDDTDKLDDIISAAFSHSSLRIDAEHNDEDQFDNENDDNHSSNEREFPGKRNRSENSSLSGILSSEKDQSKSRQSSIDIESSDNYDKNEYQFITSSKLNISNKQTINNHENDDSLSGIISSDLSKSLPKSSDQNEKSKNNDTNSLSGIISSDLSKSLPKSPDQNEKSKNNDTNSLSGIISSDLSKSLPKSPDQNEKSKCNTNSLSGIVISDFQNSKSFDDNKISGNLSNSMPIKDKSDIKISLPNYDSSHSSRNKHRSSSDGLSGILSSSLSIKEPTKSTSENSKQSKTKNNISKDSENISDILSSNINNVSKDNEVVQPQETISKEVKHEKEHNDNSSANISDILSLSNSDEHQNVKKSDSFHNSSSKSSDIVEFSTTNEREHSIDQVNPTIVLPSDTTSENKSNLQNADNMSMIDLSKTAIDQISAISLIEKRHTSDDGSMQASNESESNSLDFLDQIIADSGNEDNNKNTNYRETDKKEIKSNQNSQNQKVESPKNDIKNSKENENDGINESSIFVDFISDSKSNINVDIDSGSVKDSESHISIEYNSESSKKSNVDGNEDTSFVEINDDTGFVDDFESTINSASKYNATSTIPDGSSAVIIDIDSQSVEPKSDYVNNDVSSVVVDYSASHESNAEESFHSGIEEFESIHGGSDRTDNESVSNAIEINSTSFHSESGSQKGDSSHILNEIVETFSSSKSSQISDGTAKEESSGNKPISSIINDFIDTESTMNNRIEPDLENDFIDETSKLENPNSQTQIESDTKASDEEEHESNVSDISQSYSESSSSSIHRHHHHHRHHRKEEIKKELQMQRPYAATIRGRHETKIQYQQEHQTTVSIPPAKSHRKRQSNKDEKVLLFDPPLLSSATLKDVNACYKESLKGTQGKIRLLNQSISSMILTRREKDAQIYANGNNDNFITLDGVYKEINKKVIERRALRENDPNLLHYSSASEF